MSILYLNGVKASSQSKMRNKSKSDEEFSSRYPYGEMMLSDNQIRKRINNGDIGIEGFENLDEQISPSGIDLRVGHDYKRPATGELFTASSNPSGKIELEPGAFYNIHTTERIEIPNDVHGTTEERMSLALEGIRVASGVVNPGWSGVLVLGVENRSEETLYIDPGRRIVQLTFQELDQPAEQPYDELDDAQHQEQTGV